MNGYKSMDDEAANYFRMLSYFTHEAEAEIGWDRREQEIEMIQRECTFDKMRTFYKQLFAPQEVPMRRGKTFKERRDSMSESMQCYRAFYNQEKSSGKSSIHSSNVFKAEKMPLIEFERLLCQSFVKTPTDLKKLSSVVDSYKN